MKNFNNEWSAPTLAVAVWTGCCPGYSNYFVGWMNGIGWEMGKVIFLVLENIENKHLMF